MPGRMAGNQPGQRQKRIHQQHDVQIVQVLFMPEQHQLLPRLDQPRNRHTAEQHHDKHFIAYRPEQQGNQQSRKILRIELAQSQLPARVQQEGAAGHEKQRHTGMGNTGPEQRRQPRCQSHIPHAEGGRRHMGDNHSANRHRFHQIHRLIPRPGRRSRSSCHRAGPLSI